MSRGGRGGGRGGFGARGGFGGPSNLPPMGLTFADIQSMSREEGEMFPPREAIPMITAITEEEQRIAKYQAGFTERLRKSAFYVVEPTKSIELPRYSDKYRPQAFSQPTLKKKDLNPAFFPPDLFDAYFNPRRKQKAAAKAKRRKLDLDEFQDDQEEEEKGSDERSDKDSQIEEDYDVDEEYDNDYAENYFDNGEDDNLDDMVGGDDGMDYD